MSDDVTRAADLDQDEAPAFKVAKPVNLAQLDEEIREAMNWRSPAALSVEGRYSVNGGLLTPQEDDEETGGEMVLVVGHPNADARKIGKVLRDHEAQANWSSAEADAAMSLDALSARVVAGEVLDDLEIHAAVVGLLRERAQS